MAGSKWRTALLVFLLALTMSTAVLAAGGIGVSQLARPVTVVPPAPEVSPFRVVAGVPVTDDPFEQVPAPQVAPPEVDRASSPAAATDARVRPDRGRRPDARPGRPGVPGPAPISVPSGGGPDADEPAVPSVPRPEPRPEPRDQDTAQPDTAPADSDDTRGERTRAAGNGQNGPPPHAAAHDSGNDVGDGNGAKGSDKNPGDSHKDSEGGAEGKSRGQSGKSGRGKN